MIWLFGFVFHFFLDIRIKCLIHNTYFIGTKNDV